MRKQKKAISLNVKSSLAKINCTGCKYRTNRVGLFHKAENLEGKIGNQLMVAEIKGGLADGSSSNEGIIREEGYY